MLHGIAKSRENVVQHNTILHTAHNDREYKTNRDSTKIPKVSPVGVGG